jgi:hypothetical protein
MWYNLITTYGFIKLIELILLNIFDNERKEDFRLQEERPNLPAHLKSRGFYLQYNYNLLFYKTYRINSSEYYLGKEEESQLTESEIN